MQTETIQIPIEVLDKATKSVNDVNSGLAKTGETTKKTGMAFTELNSALMLAKQGFQYLKQAYDFAEEGANIAFTAERFDRLAESIGTTGDVLLGKMKEATRGTLSDMEAMASASDILALGLANTQDEAIRLATVQAGLAMDMNQLVLTLTNQTTMRFDALGVRVDGFKGKVKELEDQGMDTNAAFQEAFLRQAEEQLRIVGNAADSDAGSFKRLNAEVANITDSFKEQIGTALAPTAAAYANTLNEAEHYREVLQRLDGDLYNQYRATGRITPAMRELVESVVESTDAYSEQKRAVMANTTVYEENAEILEEVTKANKDYLKDLESLSREYETYQEKLREVSEDERLTVEERQAKMNEYTDDYELNTQRRILAAVEEKLAVGGLSDEEMVYLEELGLAWGVYSEEAVASAQNMRDEVNRLVDEMPSEKTFTYTMQTVGGYDIGTEQYNRVAYAGRAAGGPVMSNETYLVGERGPELFSPNTGGNITPNDKLGGGGFDYDELARTITQAFQRAMQ